MFDISNFTFQNILTVTTIWISLISLVIAYVIFNKQQDPEVIIYVALSKTHQSCLDLIVENVGAGVAYNLRITSSKALPIRAFGFKSVGNKIEYSDDGLLAKGLQYFVPKEKRIQLWGQYAALKEALDDGSVEITAHYHGHRFGKLYAKKFHSVSVVDITSFMHMEASNSQFELISKIQKIEAQLKDTNRKLRDISESLDAQTQIKEVNLKKRVWEKNS